MKTIKNILILSLIASVLVFPSCGDDDSELTIDQLIAGTWTLSSVTVDGGDATSEFTGFSMTITDGGSYTVNNGGGLLSGGTYFLNSWGTVTTHSSMDLSESSGIATYSAQVVMSNGNTTLTLSFYNPTTTFGSGRTEGARGDYVFVLNK